MCIKAFCTRSTPPPKGNSARSFEDFFKLNFRKPTLREWSEVFCNQNPNDYSCQGKLAQICAFIKKSFTP